MTHLAIGLMSGTSADGCSGVLASFDDQTFQILGFTTLAYTPALTALIHKGPQLTAREVSILNMELGELFAQTANQLLKKHQIDPSRVSCIGSHGQTLYHGPHDSPPNTLQIADARVIAERTGVAVVSDFRTRDQAAGGEGAPLVPYFEHYFFGDGPVRAFQNIGGIANVTVVGRGVDHPIAFDTGPGNCLMDQVVRTAGGGKETFDQNGHRAKEGLLHMEILTKLMQHPYLKLTPPKSTGPEMFDESFVSAHFGDMVRTHPNDVLATLNQFTCLSIQESYRNFLFRTHPIDEIVVSGGGVFNTTLMKKLESLFAPIPVISIEKMGVPAQAKEPLAFAFFGLRRILNEPNHLPTTTGAKKTLSLGSITPA